MAWKLRSNNTILANSFYCQSLMNHLELKCNVQCSCNCICGPLLQLCCLHAKKLKKNVIGAACVKHGNACKSSIFSLFCGGRQLSQGLFGGRGCANLIQVWLSNYLMLSHYCRLNCLIIIIYYNIIWTLLNVVKVSLPFCWVWIVVLFDHPSHFESRPKYPSSPPTSGKKIEQSTSISKT